MSGFKVEFSVLNLRATPGIYADALASRPAAGYPGRVFIDTDNPSTGMYRDTGTVWVQIAETATSDVDTLQNVTDNGNTTTNSISVGHSSVPVSVIDARQSTSGLNNASNWAITANNNPTIASGASFGVNYVNAIYGAQTQLFLQDATIGNSGLNTAGLFINTLQSSAPGVAGVITVTQASTIRAISGAQTGIFYGGTNVGVTYSHVAALKTFQPINTGSAATVTNNYGIIVADSTPSSGTVTYTNRWGIYQEGASDRNYYAGNILVKSTVDNGNALQITGNGTFTGTVSASNGTLIGGTGTSGQVAYWTGTNTQSGSNNLFWDNANGRLGIGTNTPNGIWSGNNRAIQILSPSNFASELVLSRPVGSQAAASVSTFLSATTSQYGFYTASSDLNFVVYTSNLERYRISPNGNMILGTTTDGGQRLQVNGDALISHSAASGTYFEVKRTSTTDRYFRVLASGNIEASSISTGDPNFQFVTGVNNTATSADRRFFWLQNNFSPTSGTATYRTLELTTTINQTGGANGITRGLYVNPTLTAAADWRSIEWSNNSGWGLYGAGTANNYINAPLGIKTTTPNAAALLQIDSTTQGFLLPRMTDAQINAITTPPDGLMVYSTDQNHIAFYNAGAGVWKKVSNSNL